MKKIISIFTTMGLLFSSMLSQAEVSSSNLSTTAKIANTCNIVAQNLNFGVLVTPLTTQSSNSELTVLCNNEAAYTIGLAYGGIYGQGTGETYYWKVTSEITSNGQPASIVQQFNSKNVATGKGELITSAYLNSYFYNNYGCSFINDKCSYIDPSYDYGKMIGGVKRDTVAYSISVPGDTSKVWNAGKNSYQSIGTGQLQTIPLNAKIVPNQSGHPFPSADMYTDTVVATISF